jgi:hypothetical protein
MMSFLRPVAFYGPHEILVLPASVSFHWFYYPEAGLQAVSTAAFEQQQHLDRSTGGEGAFRTPHHPSDDR